FLCSIVAIHGLGGTAMKTWTDSNKHLWLRDSLPDYIPNVRIMTYGYDSSVFFSTSQMAIHDFARDLFERLEYLRQDVLEEKRPLIFICHSLGGVVFKELLVQASLDKRKSPGIAGSLLKLLQVSSVELESISRHAAYLLGDLDVVSIYEQKPLGPSLIVEPFSAVLGLPNERAIPINADHREIARLSPRIPHIYLPVWTAIKELVKAAAISTTKQDLWLALESVILMDTMKNIRIFIDAVDELGVVAAEAVSSGLYRLIQGTNISRPTHRVRVFLPRRHLLAANSDHPALFTMKLSKSILNINIRAYIHFSIEDLASVDMMFHAALDLPARHRIEDHITQRAGGMFLWAQIAWDDFRKGILWNKGVLDQKLKKLDASPPGLDRLYETILRAIDDESRNDAMDIFCLISVAARPLKEHELGVLLAMWRRGSNIQSSNDFETFPNLGNMLVMRFPELIICHDDDTITFAHMSFREYLHSTWESLGSQRLIQAKKKIAEACLQYIMLEDLIEEAVSGKTRPELLSRYPLLSYAVEFFRHHLVHLSHNDPLWVLLAKTATPSSIYTLDVLRPSAYHIMTPLRLVLDEVQMPGKSKLIRKFKDAGYDMDESWLPQSQRGYALSYCTRRAKSDPIMEQMSFLLLELGANPNLPESPLISNLRSTIENRMWTLYDKLLEHPWIDLNGTDFYGQTIVHNLVHFGPHERLSYLLDHRRVDVNIRDCNWFTPIHLATSLGKPDAVRKLLTVPGVRLDLTDKSGRTPLTLATYWGQQSIALIMIEHSQVFPIPDNEALSTIVIVAKHGHQELCFRLLEMVDYKGLDSHIDHSGKGILHHAAMNDWHDMIKQCFQRGNGRLNVNQLDHSGKGALHYAAALGNTSSCLALLHNGASTQLQDRIGRTAPQAAADAGFKDTLIALLMHGDVDPNQRDIEGRNLVHWAATLDCVDVIQRLAAVPGIELARRDKHGKMPIDIAYICKCPTVGRYLSSQMRALGLNKAFSDGYYEWDKMYNSAVVDFMDLDDESGNEIFETHTGLMERQAMHQARNIAAEASWEAIQLQYPPEKWALVLDPKTELDQEGHLKSK
ncbi:ankyrin repeat-containing domain protein, partial [Xylariales sp. PMI_506]